MSYLAGLIPARAGKTRHSGASRIVVWAHPCACGENRPRCGARSQRGGSSLRVRGKQLHAAGRGVGGRLIPARAGKTPAAEHPVSHRTAHPRACGENIHSNPLLHRHLGSSPRVRGKLPRLQSYPAIARLIPARAGKTRPGPAREPASSAHPRACGENSHIFPPHTSSRGSSPRVRGKP